MSATISNSDQPLSISDNVPPHDDEGVKSESQQEQNDNHEQQNDDYEQQKPKKMRRIKVLKTKPSNTTTVESPPLEQSTNPDDYDDEQLKRLFPKPEPKMSMWNALKQEDNKDAQQTLTRMTFLIVCLPISVFYLCRYIIFPSVSSGGKLTDGVSLTYSGIAAVVMVNILTFGFVFYATCIEKDERLQGPNGGEMSEDEKSLLKERQALQLRYELHKPIPQAPKAVSAQEQVEKSEKQRDAVLAAAAEYQRKNQRDAQGKTFAQRQLDDAVNEPLFAQKQVKAVKDDGKSGIDEDGGDLIQRRGKKSSTKVIE